MIQVKDIDHYNELINGEPVCILFVAKKSPPCKVMEPLLDDVCNKRNIKLLNIVVNNSSFFPIINKYGVGTLPRYVFLKNNEVLYSAYGTERKQDIEKELKKVGV